jgi:uroporphyrin-III C-methyltransferase / precorrin-2 dehydrogenase / sirohydrochlorin ferrochelatase
MLTPTPAPPPEGAAAGEPAYFPIFLDLGEAPVLVVGGGSEAKAKAEALTRAGARVTVIATQACPGIAALAAARALNLRRRDFAESDLEGMRLCIVALADPAATAAITAAARGRGVLVNAVDRPGLSDFIVPAVVERGPVRIAISTGGSSPALARDLRARIEAAVPTGYARLARFCARWRARAAARLRRRELRRQFWQAVLAGGEADAALAGDTAAADRLIAARLGAAAQSGETGPRGAVALVGAGPGEAELLTLQARRALERADVILHDPGVAPEILALARREALRIDVGRRRHKQRRSGEAIDRLAAKHALRGARVVRLVAGDPVLLARASPALDRLRRRDIPVDIMPGISAASAGRARLLRLVAGHGAGAQGALDRPA